MFSTYFVPNPSTIKNTLLKITNLKTYFGADPNPVKAVDGVSFELSEGEVLGIVGESGSGKSVTAMSILQLLPSPPARYIAGKIELYQDHVPKDILGLSEDELRKIRGKEISIVFQNPSTSLNPTHRCGYQVQEVLLQHTDLDSEEAKNEVLKLFSQVDLPDPDRVYRSYPHMLSGGQIQRVMIAMAVACKPRLIIADEPTTALDVTVQKKIIALLKNLQKEYGCGIIFISHDLGVIHEIADKVLVMYQGKIVEQGSTDEIFLNPQHKYTQGLIACRPPLKGRLSKLATVGDFLDDDAFNIEEFKDKHVVTPEAVTKRLQALSQREHILEVRDLKKYYPNNKNWYGKVMDYTKAVDHVSFSVRKGETLGLVGESGSGKSTLGMSILRLIDDVQGSVLFEGQEVMDLNKKELKRLRKDFQVIFQDPYASLNPRIKVGEAILEPMTVHHLHNKNERKDKTIELLEMVGMEADHYYRYPHQFSGGQRQRINIARTLSLQPKFIVCDECVSALDVSVQAQILNLLLELQSKLDLSYIFISHDLSVINFISDQVMVMQKGKIVERGTTSEIFNNPQETYTQILLNSIPGLGSGLF